MTSTASLPAAKKAIELWHSNAWMVNVDDGTNVKSLNLRHPYALVGSHRCCTLRISSRQVEPIAYLVCCLGGRIESWAISEDTSQPSGQSIAKNLIDAGPCRLTFDTANTSSAVASTVDRDPETSSIKTKISCANKTQELVFKGSSVTLLDATSSDLTHCPPSRATHAAVNQDGALWIIDLAAKRMRRTERVKRLSMFENEYLIGQTKLEVVSIDANEDQWNSDIEQEQLTNHPLEQLESGNVDLGGDFDSKNNENDPESGLEIFHESSTNALDSINSAINLVGELTASEATAKSDSERTCSTPATTQLLGPAADSEPTGGPEPSSATVTSETTQPESSNLRMLISLAKTQETADEPDNKTANSAPMLGVSNHQTPSNFSMNHPENQRNVDNPSAERGKKGADDHTPMSGSPRTLSQDHWFSSLAVGEGILEVDSENPTSDNHFPSIHHRTSTRSAAELDLQLAATRTSAGPAGNDQDSTPVKTVDTEQTVDTEAEIQSAEQNSSAQAGRDTPKSRSKGDNPQNQSPDPNHLLKHLSTHQLSEGGQLSSDNRLQSSNFTDETCDPRRTGSSLSTPAAASVGGSDPTTTSMTMNQTPSTITTGSLVPELAIGAPAPDCPESIHPREPADSQNLRGNAPSALDNSQETHANSNGESMSQLKTSGTHTDMSSLSYLPEDTNTSDEPKPFSEPQFTSEAAQHAPSPVPTYSPRPVPTYSPRSPQLASLRMDPSKATELNPEFRSRVKSLSEYKIDPDELTTEISVRLANHVAPSGGLLRFCGKVLLFTMIVAVHIAVFYFVGMRIYELLYVAE